jgi:hypothetical protein
MRLNAASLLAAALMTMLAGLLTGSAFAAVTSTGQQTAQLRHIRGIRRHPETIDCTPRQLRPAAARRHRRRPREHDVHDSGVLRPDRALVRELQDAVARLRRGGADQEVLFVSTTVTLGPGTHTLSVALPDADASCFYQATSSTER